MIKYRPLEKKMGIGEMASRRALDAKFEVRILDPQLKLPHVREFFYLFKN